MPVTAQQRDQLESAAINEPAELAERAPDEERDRRESGGNERNVDGEVSHARSCRAFARGA